MALSWFIIIPLLGIMTLSFFLSFNSLKVTTLSLLFPCGFLLFFFLLDKLLLKGELLYGFGQSFNPLVKSLWGYSSKGERETLLASGTLLLLIIFALIFFTSRILVGRFVTLKDPSSFSIRKRILRVSMNIILLFMLSFSFIYFTSGFRFVLFIDEGFFAPVFNWFVPLGG